MEERIATVRALAEQFGKNEKYYKSQEFKESEVRSKFIDPLLECLGWDVRNTQQKSPNRLEVITEDNVQIDGRTKHPDYTLCYGLEKILYIEAKQPAVNLHDDKSPAFQVRRYAYTSKMPVAILTDFEEFVVFDTTVKPKENDTAYTSRIEYLTYKNYAEKFTELYKKFSWEAVNKGDFDSYNQSNDGKHGTATVDSEILKMIEEWRSLLASQIALKNAEIDEYNLTSCVQKIIDRIMFLRICEDKEIEPEKALFNSARKSEEPVYTRLKKLFDSADAKFNSGLFERDEFLDSLKVPDETLRSIIESLYFPKSPYEFSVLPVEILGNIYEKFLGKIIRFSRKTKNGRSIEIEDKPEVKKAGGVFYTPRYIVNYIVRETIGRKVDKLTPDDVKKMRFVDPACGSGSFLIGAFQFLMNWHLDYYTQAKNLKSAEKTDKIYRDSRTHAWKLSVEEKKRILVNNIFGVDIDEQAVEVTKLSLCLKLLENEGKSLNNSNMAALFRGSQFAGGRILPDLNLNIKCGNSLVGSDYYADKNLELFSLEEQRKINAFDWKSEFPRVFAAGGFDCVIGNPPYVSAPNQVDLLKEQRDKIIASKRYKTLYQKWDLYIPFVELGLNLLNNIGLYSSIIPYPVTNQTYAKILRELILKEYDLIELADLKGVKVFANATVTNCIPVIRKSHVLDETVISRLENNYEFKPFFKQKHSDLVQDEKTQVWNLTQEKRGNKYPDFHVLGDYCYISYGLRPNSDEKTAKGEFKKEELISNSEDGIPRKKYIEAKDIERYKINKIRFLEYGTRRSPAKLVRPTFNELYLHPKIMFNVLGNITGMYDNDQLIHNNSLIACVLWKDLNGIENNSIASSIKKYSRLNRVEMEQLSENIDLKYLLAVMNSKYASIILSDIRGGDYHIYPEYIRNIPIPPASPEEQSALASLADQMISAKASAARAGLSDSDRRLLEQRISILENQINARVYALYGLSPEEIAAVASAGE